MEQFTGNCSSFHCYYRNTDGKLGSACFTIISENKEHDTIAVHLFQRKLVSFLTEHFGSKPKIIIYMSDGCAGQYKNCYNFSNLCHHVEDFGVPAEWHFIATSHGKSPADGIVGTVKRTAAEASLQRPHIMCTHEITVHMDVSNMHVYNIP